MRSFLGPLPYWDWLIQEIERDLDYRPLPPRAIGVEAVKSEIADEVLAPIFFFGLSFGSKTDLVIYSFFPIPVMKFLQQCEGYSVRTVKNNVAVLLEFHGSLVSPPELDIYLALIIVLDITLVKHLCA